MSDQRAVEITQKLYQCRKQQIYLIGEEKFKEAYVNWSVVIQAAMNKHQCDPIPALIELLDKAKGKENEGMIMHLLIAITCEMLEPTITI